MDKILILLAVLLPIFGSLPIAIIKWKKRSHMMVYAEGLVLLNTALTFYLLTMHFGSSVMVLQFTGELTIRFHIDGLSAVFAGLISALWPLATLYAFEYMKHEGHERIFFMFYICTYGVTMGIALAANLLTMYCFYEMLTMVTVPLVMHTLTREAILASRKYLYYSLGGAAFAFIGMIFLIVYGTSLEFVPGGVLDLTKANAHRNVLLLVYVMTFFGFGVKAAIFPFNAWLPQAGVAPTPVTALLHAVAVVKSGAFAIMRVTYYSFGTEFLRGTWAQTFVMAFAMFTIVYGCSMAVKETHFKRRLAYSTISNLSYILFGVTMMTPAGLVGAMSHMIFHGVMKIASFFCAGAVICQSERHYVHELNGLGKRMPKVFAVFTISAFALMGVPGLCGFISKWNLAAAAVESGNALAYGGVACLLISALLTAIYMLSVVIRAYFLKEKDITPETEGSHKVPVESITDPGWMMMVPLVLFCIAMVVFGLHPQPLIDFFWRVAGGM
jgi:multicomponent Na+:H+ antiporter subunit D